LRRGIFNILGIFQVTQQNRITQLAALTILVDELLSKASSCGLLLRTAQPMLPPLRSTML
jgi:hypothetical protein